MKNIKTNRIEHTRTLFNQNYDGLYTEIITIIDKAATEGYKFIIASEPNISGTIDRLLEEGYKIEVLTNTTIEYYIIRWETLTANDRSKIQNQTNLFKK